MNIQIDEQSIKELQSKFDSLSFKDQQGIYKAALGSSANILKRATKNTINSSPFKKNSRLLKGVRHKVKLYSGNNSFARVYLTGWLIPLEIGTVQRQTKKGYNRGSINAYKFFDQAKAQSESAVFQSIESNIVKSIYRKWNKANK